uniref:Glycosyltransferase n=1 Tax=viral metagenome TaxID=1070528 RepID=A0A6C0JIZ8_9ZZZZ
MFEFVDHVVYINLSNRTDRRMSIEAELAKYFPNSKISRFNATHHEKGYIGCTMSHIGVIKLAILRGWKNCLIVEDDAIWSNFEKGYYLLETLVRKPYDIITFGTTFTTYNRETYKLYSGQTTTAYLINSSYYQTYLDNMVEGLSNLVESNSPGHYALDIYWKKLQARDNWYCIMPALMVQKEGYSDIEKRNVNYDHYFNIQQIAK